MRKSLIRISLLVATCTAVMASCTTEVTPKTKKQKSYITQFVKCEQLYITGSNTSTLDLEKKKFFWQYLNEGQMKSDVSLNVNATLINPNLNEHEFYPAKNDDDPRRAEKQAVYERYIKQLNDMTFVWNSSTCGPSRDLTVTCVPLKSVAITADKDFGEDLPAGADLGQLFHILFDDVAATISAGYTATSDCYRGLLPDYQWVFGPDQSTCSPISLRCLPLKDAPLEDYSFTEARWVFFLDDKPEKPDTYTFHVQMTFADGTVLEADSPPILIKGEN